MKRLASIVIVVSLAGCGSGGMDDLRMDTRRHRNSVPWLHGNRSRRRTWRLVRTAVARHQR